MKRKYSLNIEITIPVEFEADVVNDLERRGGTVRRADSVRAISGDLVIKGTIPSEASLVYGTELRALTAGHGTFQAHIPNTAD